MAKRDRTLRELREAIPRPADAPAKRITYLSQEEVADVAGVDRSAYNQLERGRRTFTMTYAERLAPVLGPEVYELVETRDEPRAPEIELRMVAVETAVDELTLRVEEVETVQAQVQEFWRRTRHQEGGTR